MIIIVLGFGQEWEEKLSQSIASTETLKDKYHNLKSTIRNEGYMEQARAFAAKTHDSDEPYDISSSMYGSVRSAASKAETVVSGVSGFAQQARSIVMNSSFNCASAGGLSGADANDDDDDDDDEYDEDNAETKYEKSAPPSAVAPRGRSTKERPRSRPKANNGRFKEYSRSPHRVDI